MSLLTYTYSKNCVNVTTHTQKKNCLAQQMENIKNLINIGGKNACASSNIYNSNLNPANFVFDFVRNLAPISDSTIIFTFTC